VRSRELSSCRRKSAQLAPTAVQDALLGEIAADGATGGCAEMLAGHCSEPASWCATRLLAPDADRRATRHPDNCDSFLRPGTREKARTGIGNLARAVQQCTASIGSRRTVDKVPADYRRRQT
jgi:hypothetical protein